MHIILQLIPGPTAEVEESNWAKESAKLGELRLCRRERSEVMLVMHMHVETGYPDSHTTSRMTQSTTPQSLSHTYTNTHIRLTLLFISHHRCANTMYQWSHTSTYFVDLLMKMD